MYRWIICAAVIAAFLPGACGWGRHRRCFPTEVTKLSCFSDLPNAAFIKSSSWLKWIMPNSQDDTYLLDDDNSTEVLDTEEFTITKIEQDPQFFCDHKEKLLRAMSCLAEDALSRCPYMPEFINYHLNKTTKSLGYLCSRMSEIDKLCLQAHWDVSHTCRHQEHMKMRADMFKSRSSHRSRSSHSSWSSKRGNRTYSRSWKRHASRDWCQYHYNVNECARKVTEQCHGKTAQIMFDLGKNISSANCSARMDAWAAARTDDDVTDCDDGRCGATALLPVAMATLLLSVFAAFWE